MPTKEKEWSDIEPIVNWEQAMALAYRYAGSVMRKTGYCGHSTMRQPRSDVIDDIVQLALLQLVSTWSTRPHYCSFGTWLFINVRGAVTTITRNRRRIDGTKSTVGELERFAVQNSDSYRDGTAEYTELEQHICDGVAALNETLQLPFRMRVFEGKSAKEIAGILGVTPAAVDMRIHRAREQLAGYLYGLGYVCPWNESPASPPPGKIAYQRGVSCWCATMAV
ncbi:MAG TPA: sigma-70 family RNA polymerase sigma factor [Pirellulaceae bacterium]|nr:sigma-70 family RNA polymerase sigma factor [Pirellulaceae bacterium]HMO94283.1 sigma-70 family RNA polymerase sigma factor [Pirellulaceae bacterium]HMP70815.1 sigma-70 family RNA polymerase sigma factor [Pirellulaceae bacterium]